MRCLIIVLFLAFTLPGCKSSPTTTTSSNKDAERQHPDDFLKVNYQVHRNLVGKKVVEGEVINTGKYMTFKSVTLKIVSIKEGNDNATNYTVSETLAPGGKAGFKFKPEGNPESIKVSVASATAE